MYPWSLIFCIWIALVKPWTSQYRWEAECTGTSCLVADAQNLSDLKQIILKSFRMVFFCRAERWSRKCKSFVCNALLEALPYSHGYAGRSPLALGYLVLSAHFSHPLLTSMDMHSCPSQCRFKALLPAWESLLAQIILPHLGKWILPCPSNSWCRHQLQPRRMNKYCLTL